MNSQISAIPLAHQTSKKFKNYLNKTEQILCNSKNNIHLKYSRDNNYVTILCSKFKLNFKFKIILKITRLTFKITNN